MPNLPYPLGGPAACPQPCFGDLIGNQPPPIWSDAPPTGKVTIYATPDPNEPDPALWLTTVQIRNVKNDPNCCPRSAMVIQAGDQLGSPQLSVPIAAGTTSINFTGTFPNPIPDNTPIFLMWTDCKGAQTAIIAQAFTVNPCLLKDYPTECMNMYWTTCESCPIDLCTVECNQLQAFMDCGQGETLIGHINSDGKFYVEAGGPFATGGAYSHLQIAGGYDTVNSKFWLSVQPGLPCACVITFKNTNPADAQDVTTYTTQCCEQTDICADPGPGPGPIPCTCPPPPQNTAQVVTAATVPQPQPDYSPNGSTMAYDLSIAAYNPGPGNNSGTISLITNNCLGNNITISAATTNLAGATAVVTGPAQNATNFNLNVAFTGITAAALQALGCCALVTITFTITTDDCPTQGQQSDTVVTITMRVNN